MTPTLLIDLISEQRFFISNMCTFFGTHGIGIGNQPELSVNWNDEESPIDIQIHIEETEAITDKKMETSKTDIYTQSGFISQLVALLFKVRGTKMPLTMYFQFSRNLLLIEWA